MADLLSIFQQFALVQCQNEKSLPITGLVPVVRSLCTFMKLCIHINANTGFQLDGDAVIPDDNLLDPASYQHFIEFCKIGGLLRYVILQVIDSLYLFVPCGGIDGCFLTEFSESEDFIRYFVVVLFAVGFLDQFLLQRHQLFVNVVNGRCLRCSDDCGNVKLELCLIVIFVAE